MWPAGAEAHVTVIMVRYAELSVSTLADPVPQLKWVRCASEEKRAWQWSSQANHPCAHLAEDAAARGHKAASGVHMPLDHAPKTVVHKAVNACGIQPKERDRYDEAHLPSPQLLRYLAQPTERVLPEGI